MMKVELKSRIKDGSDHKMADYLCFKPDSLNITASDIPEIVQAYLDQIDK